MKKFYSLVLMAAALLIGTNVWADDISVVNHTKGTSQTFNDLQEAVDFVGQNDSATITLLNSITLTKAVVIPHVTSSTNPNVLNRLPQKITLDLAGNDITGGTYVVKNVEFADKSKHDVTYGYGCIQLVKGNLHIVGTGKIERGAGAGSGNQNRSAVTVYGAPWDHKSEVWTVLTIGENVTLSSNTAVLSEDSKVQQNKLFGLCIQDLGALPNGYVADDTKTEGKLGYTTSKSISSTASTNPFTAPILCAKQNSKKTSWNAACAYGVKVFIEGKIFGYYRGINVVGNINAAPQCDINENVKRSGSYPYYTYYYPYVKIAPTAEIFCINDGISNDGNGGIYAGGYVVWDISGYIHGQTGILAKSGDFILNDAVVASDSESENANSGEYHKGETAGSGIFIASDASYAGGTSVTLEGDTKVSGNGSSAITDVLAQNTNGESTVSHIDINSGTIEPGKGGAITLSSEDVVKTTVAGGNISGVVTTTDAQTGEQTTVTVASLTDASTSTVTTVTDENGKTTYVVGPGKATDIKESTVVYNAGKDSIKWTGASETLAGNVKIDYLEINEMEATAPKTQTLTVPVNTTLEVKRVVLGYGAKIIVEPGAKFIVTGEQGIVAPVVDNIVLQSAGNKHATFLFNPAVTSNRHPNATVQFVSKSWYTDASHYQWERFGIPTWKALTSIESDIAGLYTNIQVFENNGWTDLGYLVTGTPFANIAQMNKPFATYNLLAYKGTAGVTYTMKGELVGNENAELNTDREWNSFANSYAADVDMVTLLAGLAGGVNIDKTVYFAQPAGLGHYVWEAVNKDWVAGEKIAPMQVFLLHNSTATPEASVLNYSNMVWTPATTPASAPRRRVASDDNIARLRVVVANEEGIWDNVKLSENSDANNAVKYMNEDVNIYAMNDEKDAIVAAENLENMYLGFSTVKGGNFTISFDNVAGREFDLIDMETGAKVAVMEGATYEFTAAANTVADYRFKLVERNNAPTAIDNTEAIKSATGIYTITGQYMGEMNVWNTLPAGVYVVNGEKRVK